MQTSMEFNNSENMSDVLCSFQIFFEEFSELLQEKVKWEIRKIADRKEFLALNLPKS